MVFSSYLFLFFFLLVAMEYLNQVGCASIAYSPIAISQTSGIGNWLDRRTMAKNTALVTFGAKILAICSILALCNISLAEDVKYSEATRNVQQKEQIPGAGSEPFLSDEERNAFASVWLEGAIQRTSTIPDANHNDYPNCFYTVELKVYISVYGYASGTNEIIDSSSLPPGEADSIDLFFPEKHETIKLTFEQAKSCELKAIETWSYRIAPATSQEIR